jgi:hypothetical protein
MPLVCVIGEWRCVSCWGGGEGSVRADDDPTLYDEAVGVAHGSSAWAWDAWCAEHQDDILAALKKYDGASAKRQRKIGEVIHGLDAEITAPSGMVIARGPVPLTVASAPEAGIYAYRYFDEGKEVANGSSAPATIGDHLVIMAPTLSIL